MTFQPITIVICDDKQVYLDQHIYRLRLIQRQHNIAPGLIDIKTFEDGVGALNFIDHRGKVDDVMLITDMEMPRLKGDELIADLEMSGLLPVHTIINSSAGVRDIEERLTRLGVKTPVTMLDKMFEPLEEIRTHFLAMLPAGSFVPKPATSKPAPL